MKNHSKFWSGFFIDFFRLTLIKPQKSINVKRIKLQKGKVVF